MANQIIDKIRQQFTGKKVLVVGLGIQGGGAGIAEFFAQLGAQVTVTDLKTEQDLSQSVARLKPYSIRYVLGRHNQEDFLNADLIFKAPKMRWDVPDIQAAIHKGVPVQMEMAFFMQYCPAPVIGITGTRGKSTTTQLVYRVAQLTGKNVYLAGNIPQTSTISLLRTVNPEDLVVLELSSWQLSAFHRTRKSPHIAVFTNLYPDHLDYYRSMEEYAEDKKAIFAYQSKDDHLVIHRSLEPLVQSVSLTSSVTYYTKDDFEHKLKHLPGDHNKENAAAALKTAAALPVPPEKAVEVITEFKGLPYRQETVATTDSITVINDTTSTTPTATIKAIEAFHDKPLILLLGGTSKNLPYDQLLKTLSQVHSIVLLKGGFTDQILPELKTLYPDKISPVFDDLKEAVQEAFRKASTVPTQSYIVFSPGGPSFAMFKNEFHRGEEFNRIVREILPQV